MKEPEQFENNSPQYVWNSEYFSVLRSNYTHILELNQFQKNTLVSQVQFYQSAQQAIQERFVISSSVIVIVAYGQIQMNDEIYRKGMYFQIPTACPKCIELQLSKKSALIVLQKNYLQYKMNTYQIYYEKKTKIFQTLPMNQIILTNKALTHLIDQVNIQQVSSSLQHTLLDSEVKKGIFILFDGVFHVIKKQLKLQQVSFTYVGQEILWLDKYQFNVRSVSYSYKYIFLSLQLLQNIFSAQDIKILKKFYQKRKNLRTQIQKNYKKNIKIINKFMKQTKLTHRSDKQENPNKASVINNNKIQLKKHIYRKQEKQQFERILDQMHHKGLVPKWKQEQIRIQEQKNRELKYKFKYSPKKIKKKSFSTLTNKYWDPTYHQHPSQFKKQSDACTPEAPLTLKLSIYQRSQTAKELKTHYLPQTIIFGQSNTPFKLDQTLRTTQTHPTTPLKLTIKECSWKKLKLNRKSSISIISPRSTRVRKSTQTPKSTPAPQTVRSEPKICKFYSINYDRTLSNSLSIKAKIKTYKDIQSRYTETSQNWTQTLPQAQYEFQTQVTKKLGKKQINPNRDEQQQKRRNILFKHMYNKTMFHYKTKRY